MIGCSTITVESQPNDRVDEVYVGEAGYDVEVYRFTDPDYDAICWVSVGFQKGGISCIPLKDLVGE